MKNIKLKATSALGALFLLCACGFTPVYGINGSNIGPVEVAPIEGRLGFFLVQNLKRRAGLETAAAEKRDLEVKIAAKFNNVSLRSDGFTSRNRVTYDAEYILRASGKLPEIKGKVTSIVSYDSAVQAYSDVSLQSDAEERAANDLADRIWADLINKTRANKN